MNPTSDRATVTCVQPIAIVDHIARLTEDELREVVGDETGGSRRVERDTISCMLEKTGASKFETRPGGSSANTIRALSGGFKVQSRLLGARGSDDWGLAFEESMTQAGIHVSCLQVHNTPTGRSLILSCGGDRTMRTCLEGCTRLQAADVTSADLASQFVVLSAYCMYGGSFTAEVVAKAKQGGAAVVLDLASWEIVGRFHNALWDIVSSGGVHTLSGNEDEWLALAEHLQVSPQPHTGGYATENGNSGAQNGASTGPLPPCSNKQHEHEGKHDEKLQIILAMQREVVKHCQLAVATRSSLGCVAMDSAQHYCEPALHMSSLKDTTGAGDLFGAGFLYGQLSKCSLQACCKIGCIVGAAATQVEGAFLTPEMWGWVYERMQADPSIKLPASPS